MLSPAILQSGTGCVLLNGGHTVQADIARNHAQQKQRRLAPIVALAGQQDLALPQPRLRAALADGSA